MSPVFSKAQQAVLKDMDTFRSRTTQLEFVSTTAEEVFRGAIVGGVNYDTGKIVFVLTTGKMQSLHVSEIKDYTSKVAA